MMTKYLSQDDKINIIKGMDKKFSLNIVKFYEISLLIIFGRRNLK